MKSSLNSNLGKLGLTAFAAVVLLMAAGTTLAQKKMNLAISANAMGTSTQLGRVVMVDIRIFEFSTPEDQKALLEAFAGNGQEGLANAVEKMSSKGRIAITGTLGFDLKYIREFKMPDGSRMIRFVTDRPIRFAEAWGSTRSMDYSLALGEIIISKEKGKTKGTLMPASKLILGKDKELGIETYQNPWNLVNIKIW